VPSTAWHRLSAELRERKNVCRDQKDLPFGIAIADIQQSEPHYHELTMETYTAVQGDLEVSLDTEAHVLHTGDVIKILPGVVHSARSLNETPARITVTMVPAFSQTDYYAVN
jgi:quercetin dioxygenase-like cupin family protein